MTLPRQLGTNHKKWLGPAWLPWSCSKISDICENIWSKHYSKSTCGEEKGALGELAETPILINSGGKVQIIICHCVLKWQQIAAWFYKRRLLVLMKSKA